jgi:hypothetical protein
VDSAARHLFFNATIVLLIGLICGAPYGRAIVRNEAAGTVHSWRVAHLSLPLGATLMFAVAATLPMLSVSSAARWLIAITSIVSA